MVLSITLSSFLSACGKGSAIPKAYDINNTPMAYSILEREESVIAEPFSSGICVVSGDIDKSEDLDMSLLEAAGLFDTKNNEVKYAKNVHEKLNPASLTKVLTALVALKQAGDNLDAKVSVSENAVITESGAQLCGFKPGDTLTLEQALHGLLMYSGNDAGVVIAEHIAGSVEAFSDMMNEEAKRAGATNSHFSNPHGLTDPEHYTTAYDLYLIFNEAVKNEKFVEIIGTPLYETTYTRSNGNTQEVKWKNTNLFLQEESGFKAPENTKVIGGKTGTTAAAGSCLIIMSNDASGTPYISVILKSEDRNTMYIQMTNLLKEINK